MKIIISPSKTQKITRLTGVPFKALIYKEKTNYLVKLMKKLKTAEIKKMMKTSDKLTDEIHNNYKNFFTADSGHAVASYTGIAYRTLWAGDFSKMETEYMEKHLVILSALYGVLTPLTEVSLYRLDMTMSILKKGSLYEFWQESINEYFEKEELIINLASKEFSKMIKKPLINIEFFEEKNGGLVQISTNSKKARGEMTKLIIKNKTEKLNDMKKITFSGYEFNKKLSADDNLVFVKK